jgi:hypothetical protein
MACLCPRQESRCRSPSRSCVDWFRDVSKGQIMSHFNQVDQTQTGIGGNLVTLVRRSRSTGRSTQENTVLRTVCSGVRTGECAQHSLRVSFAPCISGSPLLPRTCVLPVNAPMVDSPFVALGCAPHLPTQFFHQPRGGASIDASPGGAQWISPLRPPGKRLPLRCAARTARALFDYLTSMILRVSVRPSAAKR